MFSVGDVVLPGPNDLDREENESRNRKTQFEMKVCIEDYFETYAIFTSYGLYINS